MSAPTDKLEVERILSENDEFEAALATNKAEAIELKPCPFCGSEARHGLYIRDGGKVQCTNGACYANTFQFNPNATQKAITAWNTRSPPIELVEDELVERVAKAIALSADGNLGEWNLWLNEARAAIASLGVK